jgi:hypothetical protein
VFVNSDGNLAIWSGSDRLRRQWEPFFRRITEERMTVRRRWRVNVA